MKKTVANWGNYPRMKASEQSFQFEKELKTLIDNSEGIIARGNGRCYGDASLAGQIASTLKYDKIIEFDTVNGILNCQSGVTLSEILEVIVPKGWFLPVTPGTKYITVGGALASDVHGKNHHAEGSFSNHIIEFTLLGADGSVSTITKASHPGLFEATCGGMGLTGVVLDVKFSLKKVESCYINQKQVKARNLDEIFALFEEYQHYTYSMSWIDCFQSGNKLGRSILIVGEHATAQETAHVKGNPLILPEKKKLTMPVYLPSFTLNQLSIKAFNFMYYHKNYKHTMQGIVPYDS